MAAGYVSSDPKGETGGEERGDDGKGMAVMGRRDVGGGERKLGRGQEVVYEMTRRDGQPLQSVDRFLLVSVCLMV